MPHQVNRGRKINIELAPNFEVVHVGDDEARHHSCESLRFDPSPHILLAPKSMEELMEPTQSGFDRLHRGCQEDFAPHENYSSITDISSCNS